MIDDELLFQPLESTAHFQKELITMKIIAPKVIGIENCVL